MDPAQHLILTDIALRAARDHKSRKPAKRLRAAMNAVLDFDKAADEETLLMAAVAGTIRVVDDLTADAIQRELYGLGRISSLMQEGAGDIDEAALSAIEKDMPPLEDRLGILNLWEQCRVKHGLIRDVALELPEAPATDIGGDPDDWENPPKKNSENSN